METLLNLYLFTSFQTLNNMQLMMLFPSKLFRYSLRAATANPGICSCLLNAKMGALLIHQGFTERERILLNTQLHWKDRGEDDLSKSAGCDARDREKLDEFDNE